MGSAVGARAEDRLGRIEAQLERVCGQMDRAATIVAAAGTTIDGVELAARRMVDDMTALRNAFTAAVNDVAATAARCKATMGDTVTAAQHIRTAHGAALEISQHLARAAKVAASMPDVVAGSKAALVRVTELARAMAPEQNQGEAFLESGRELSNGV